MRTFVAILGCLLLSLVCSGPSDNPPMPAAYEDYTAAIAQAQRVYQEAQAKAAKEYEDALSRSLAASMKNGDLDRANAIKAERDKIQAEEASLKTDPPAIVILSAKYGRDQTWVDATDFVKTCVKDTRLTIPSNFSVASHLGEPIPGYRYINIKCTYQGKPMTFYVFDGPSDVDLDVDLNP